jgi:uncharacterized membrane protein YvlD (DUF360 family)
LRYPVTSLGMVILRLLPILTILTLKVTVICMFTFTEVIQRIYLNISVSTV